MQQIRSVVRNIGSGVAVACTTAVLAVQSALAGMPAGLSQAPEGAQLVVIVPSMSELSGKIAMLNQTLGLEVDEMADALGTFKAESGIGEGLDDAGSALFIISDLATAMENKSDPDVVMVLPVTDYQAFIAGFQAEGAAPAGAGVTAVTMPDGQPGFAKEAGGYAILGNSEAGVTNYAAGGDAEALADHVGQLGQHYMDSADVAAYIDMASLAPTLNTLIDDAVTEMNAEFDNMAQGGMMQASDLETMKIGFKMYETAGKAIVNSAEGLVITLDISENGVGYTHSLKLKPDSVVQQYLPGGGEGTASILSRLPKGPYIAAMAFDAESVNVAKLMDIAMGQFPEGNPQVDIYRKYLPLVKQVKQYAGVLYTPAPNAMMTQSGVINMLQTYKVDDSAAFLTQAGKYIEEMDGMSIPMAIPAAQGGEPPAMTYTTSYTENALQLDGVQVDQYSMNMQMPQEMLMQMGPAAGMMGMFTNFNGYATQADGYYLSSTTLDQQLITQGLATGKSGDGVGSNDALADVRENAVPPGAVAEGYLSFAGIVQTLSPMASMMIGLPAIEAPADLPPIAMGLGVQGDSTAVRFYIPNETTKFVIDTVKDVQSQMMGGPGGPGGPNGGQNGAPPPPF